MTATMTRDHANTSTRENVSVYQHRGWVAPAALVAGVASAPLLFAAGLSAGGATAPAWLVVLAGAGLVVLVLLLGVLVATADQGRTGGAS